MIDHEGMDDEAFEVYDPTTGEMVYESSKPPSTCGWGGPCGDCDTCATMRAPDHFRTRPARPWTPWPLARQDWCRWCRAGAILTIGR